MIIKESVLLKDKNTFKIGGLASYYAEPSDENEVLYCVNWAKDKNLPIFILGRGSNVLISDLGWNGLVVNLSANFCGISWNRQCVNVLGGSSLNSVCSQACKNGLEGLEELAGIPGTVGGAVLMNAGAFNAEIANSVKAVRYYDCSSLEIKEIENVDMNFGYRKSIFQNFDNIILNVALELTSGKSSDELEKVRAGIIQKRNLKQPVQYPNCGSVFKRPGGNYAGTLIEKCGLKGFRVGDVEISEKHANFIINRGNGTARDVREIIVRVQETVFKECGIILEPEVIFVGEFEKPLFRV
ncbi:MAG: UDP-N-acetylmuramate dehydrogenase [Fibrobacter sp.]|nr:UDP-N-acetylmuramate dehydrogenase [Fibrobacter sp.]